MQTFRKLTLLVVTSAFLYFASCVPPDKVTTPSGPVAGISDTAQKWLNWIAIIKPEATPLERLAFMDSLRDQLLDVRSDVTIPASDSVNRPFRYYLAKYLRDSLVTAFQVGNVEVRYCNCGDSLLWNVEADLYHSTDTSGPSNPTSPRPGSGTTVSGGVLELLSKNELMENPAEKSSFIDNSSPFTIPSGYRMSGSKIAVIDTGIDSLLLDQQLRSSVILKGANGSKNFIRGLDCDNYFDDHPVKHGTAVSSIILNAFHQESAQAYLPSLMILKAADSAGRGTVFEYSCALAYAIKNRVKLINSSMGFYGQESDIIDFYLRAARRDSIVVVAAAGNANEEHQDPLCRSDANPSNRLEPSRLYHPAALAENIERYLLISVTGLSVPGRACFYQNYSDRYVTIGVANETAAADCCAFRLPFIAEQRAVEGSSFATPVVSGRLGFRIFQQGSRSSVRNFLVMLGNVSSAPVIDQGPVTQDNQYFSY